MEIFRKNEKKFRCARDAACPPSTDGLAAKKGAFGEKSTDKGQTAENLRFHKGKDGRNSRFPTKLGLAIDSKKL